MATVKIHKADGAEAGSLELSDAIFGIEPNTNCVRSALDHFMHSQRSGTHSTKTRGFVRGGGKKPWRQKGTGRARQGSIRAPQWRGGAVIFGPQPRDYSFHLNKKVKRKALCSVFSELAREGRIVAIEDFGVDAPKTSKIAALFDKMNLEGRILLYVDAADEKLILSSRNIPYVDTVNADNPNIYDLLTHDYVVAKPETLKRLEGAFAS